MHPRRSMRPSLPRALTRAVALVLALSFGPVSVFGLSGCSDETRQPPQQPWPDGWLPADLGVVLDSHLVDLGQVPDGLPQDKDGPSIKFLSPVSGQVVVGTTLTVKAEITDPDGVDDQSVTLSVQGQTEVTKLSVTTTQSVYEALLDIAQFTDKIRIWITATDLLGKKNTQIVEFRRDPGPTVVFLSPAEDSRHRSSVSVQILVSDAGGKIASFSASIGNYQLTLSKVVSDAQKDVYAGTVQFNDSMFKPSLSGMQVLTATATNGNGAKTTVYRSFHVDDEGPAITVTSHQPGELIGGIVKISAEIKDLAEVVASSVKCIVGKGLDNRVVELKSSPAAPDLYEGQFDTRTLTQYYLWPVMSFRAADKLGNESHMDIQVGLDNGAPVVELDPPADYHAAKLQNGVLYCSRPFDPVGSDATDDLKMVPQIVKIRARIEDQGNHVPSAPFVPVALVDEKSVWLYVLDDTSKALLVDTDGDGYCDDINPEVVPLGSNPQLSEAVAVALAPVPPVGEADFRPPDLDPLPPVPAGCDSWGVDPKAPDPLCLGTPVRRAISYTTESEAAIYTIPPVTSSGTCYKCLGLPFDFAANQVADGWACAAVVAKDALGNRGVSPPLRLWVKKDLLAIGAQQLPGNAGTPPHCTGVLDKVSGKVDSSTTCAFRNPREGSLPAQDLFVCDKVSPAKEFPQQFCHNEVVLQ